ncbi:biotin--[acetyl-CoA-carboxylase] ligase [Nakamurella sp. PAMC28650]|uniref:biotin--[acetyl-CoA-carboxylase] ligase n=1 Tax=Nakamurella sp. PAMC28650 TaxID=2762325 RepID=UPI00164CEC75|nr:biotin--[acetyl-CoA-carboxylase] ligase [Nakamurella sp. PAMC28650]QNK83147.1 biotin--[acetyl-CoA-carboxylase] ligase [Nakamurella sp. PAMC28650]
MTTSDRAGVPAPDRRPMAPGSVAAALQDRAPWEIRHVLSTGSTNDDLARGGGPGGAGASVVLVTEEQTAGKGRSGRHWACPPGAGLMFSVRLALSGNSGISEIPIARRGWIGAALGLAVCHGFADVAGVHARLKWPNDVLVDGHKCGGILAEMTGDAVIVGAGLNVSLLAAELPRADATSLLLAGAGSVDRNVLLARILDGFSRLLSAWRQAGGDVDVSGLRPRYLDTCATIGSSVRVELPGRAEVAGIAVDVDPDGAVVVQDVNGVRSRHTAGDVVHLRPADAGGVR